MTNILVIDDNQEITTMLEAILSSDTCHVQTANNGRYGLQMLMERPFDVVITDIIMPELDGFEVITEINRMQPRPRVIAMTGGSERLSREYLANVGDDLSELKILYKPHIIDELLIFLHEGGAEATM